MVIATKGGLTRQGPDEWAAVGRPEYLRQCVQMSLRLGLERIDLWQLHRIDPKVPADDSPIAARADEIGATRAQVALAWLLDHSPVMIPIPGTGSVAHLEENCAAATVSDR